ncbi:O-acetyl-ADP-ribose deacetylase (regulator of RNase III), contains Macro domain [Fodinibius roseus]|uniref:O-acetyl-ADP-ribose deacetylase (Regulator of RNase III), contains Macro domain n=1 Tax=Fodinibius roseus TaxID=1194090 RepID=A0A1M4V2J3_9BACT|nr:macro domain-containing protein [Fodinibius roseus]SHE63130.1 O-acetyl-ADP-ribose deacetylase (regulator of RNase III), contains Macro domain [Fodinibius roseus]
MKEIRVDEVQLELRRGDIANQPDMDAVVNAANAQLRTGGGVAGAIHRAAGPELSEETCSMAPIKPGEAVISGGHQLPNEYIIHCLGPVYGRDKPEDKLLGFCYKNALKVAEDHGIERIAFPAISTGAFGYPPRDAAHVAFTTIQNEIPQLQSVKLLRFVLWGEDAMRIHQDVMDEVFS